MRTLRKSPSSLLLSFIVAVTCAFGVAMLGAPQSVWAATGPDGTSVDGNGVAR